jgi:hypothetical protein
MDEVYDVRIDRLDVAVRSLIRLFRSGRWQLLRPMGITRAEHHESIDTALLEITSIKTEAGIFQLLQACPFLLEPAIELQSAYQARCRDQRLAHYRRTA